MSVDDSQLRALIRDLGAVPAAVRKQLRPAAVRAAEPVVQRMRANASWSTRIPGAISAQPASSTAGVTIRVDARRAPHARPYEGLSGDPFRHPVYGNRKVWVSQAARPFFYRAVDAKAGEVAEVFGEAVMEAAQELGF